MWSILELVEPLFFLSTDLIHNSIDLFSFNINLIKYILIKLKKQITLEVTQLVRFWVCSPIITSSSPLRATGDLHGR
jgi:hypothetical protein